ncbi:hypothetical protein [Alcaligenes sp. Marseille-Q7550]
MTQIAVGKTVAIKTGSVRSKNLTEQNATITAVTKKGRGHTVKYTAGGKEYALPYAKFEASIARA